MEQVNEDIKKEFDDKIKTIEEIDKKKENFLNKLCNIVAVLLFISVLMATLLSYHNYQVAIQKQNQQNIKVVEFK